MKPDTSSKVMTLLGQYFELRILYVDLFVIQNKTNLRPTGSAGFIEEP
jgi:hypothetical protein